MNGGLASKRVSRRSVAVLGGCLFATAIFAAPQGGVIVDGQGSIQSPNATTTTVQQTSQALVVNWDSFNLSANETVNFNQPSSNAAALNRIFDQNPSQIFGSINANGRVFLSNPNGVYFGASSRVNVGALIATSLKISPSDFMQGNYNLVGGDGAGAIVNQGIIQAASGGSVALIGNSVRNEGVIVADYGHVVLASGRQAVINFDGDGLLNFQIDAAVLENTVGAEDAVHNSGNIIADAGQILLSARASEDIFTNVINNEGLLQATRIENQGGVILLAGDSGRVISSGDIIATGENGVGGEVHLLGDQVGLFDDATVDVSGSDGGGVVLIGGDFQGQGDTRTAELTYVAADASIRADGGSIGDGGTVIVWADETTRYYGAISARGGSVSGDGGFVEVSGKQNLGFFGKVDTGAPSGVTGMLLLDPDDLYVGADPGGGEILRPSPPFEANDGTNDYYVLASSLTGDSTYTLLADNNVIFNADVTFGTSGGNSVSITAVNDINSDTFSIGTSGGTLTLNSATMVLGAIDTDGGLLTINNSAAATQTGAIAGNGGLTKTGNGTFTLSQPNNYTGATTVNGGTLQLGAANRLANGSAVTVDSGTLDMGAFNDTVASLAVTNGGTLSGSGTLTAATYSLDAATIDANLGAGTLTKNATGTATLNGTAAATTVNVNGTLQLGAANRLANGSAVTVDSGTLDMGAANDTVASLAVTNGGTLSGSGTLTAATYSLDSATIDANLGAGTLTKTATETATLNGTAAATTVNVNGSLQLGAANRLSNSSAVTVNNGGTLDIGANSDVVGAVTLIDGSIIGSTGVLTGTSYSVQRGDISAILSGAGAALTKNTTGTVTLSAANSYGGGTIINNGTLAIDNAGSAGTGTIAVGNATLDIINGAIVSNPVTIINGTIANSAGTGTLQTGGVMLLTNSGLFASSYLPKLSSTTGTGLTVSAAIQDQLPPALFVFPSTIEKVGVGTVTLTGANTFNGDVTITQGTLVGTTTSLPTRIINNSTLTFDQAFDGGFVDQIFGSGDLVKEGTGSVTLSGTNLYQGGTTINAGTLSISRDSNLGLVGVATPLTINNGALETTANFTLNSARGIVLNGGALIANSDITIAGSVSVTADSSLGGSGNLLATGAITSDPGSNLDIAASTTSNVTPSSTSNDLDSVTITSANNVTLVDMDDIDLGTSSVIGNLTVTSSMGNITNNGGTLNVMGDATFNADSGGSSITLGNNGNVFAGNFTIACDCNAGADSLADVTIVDRSPLSLDFLAALAASVDSDIAGNLNVVADEISVNENLISDGDLSLTSTQDLVLVGNVTLESTGGTLSLNTAGTITGNNITLNSATSANAISFSTNTTIDAGGSLTIWEAMPTGDLDLIAIGDISLNGQFTTASGDLSLSTMNSVNVSGVVTMSSGDIGIVSANLSITPAGMLDANSGIVTVSDPGGGDGITLTSTGTGSGLLIDEGESGRIMASELILLSDDGISLSEDFDSNFTGQLTFDARTVTINVATFRGQSDIEFDGGLNLDNANVTVTNQGSLTIETNGSFSMSPGSSIHISNNAINITTLGAGSNAILGLLDTGGGNVGINAASDILNGFGAVSNVKLSKTNIVAGNTVNLAATGRIGASSTDAITIDANMDGDINLSFGAQFAYINNLNFTDINCGGCPPRQVIVGLVFSNQVIGIGHNIGLDSTETLNPLDQSNYNAIEGDETLISILGADFQILFDEDDEDDIVSTIIPSVPVMIKTLEGWEFIAPSRRQNIDKLRENQKKGETFIDWL